MSISPSAYNEAERSPATAVHARGGEPGASPSSNLITTLARYELIDYTSTRNILTFNMMPAFGFSVGEIRQRDQLVKRVKRWIVRLRNAVVEIKGPPTYLDALEPTENSIVSENIREFRKELGRYDATLGRWRDRIHFCGAVRKATWAVAVGREVEEPRAGVAVKGDKH